MSISVKMSEVWFSNGHWAIKQKIIPNKTVVVKNRGLNFQKTKKNNVSSELWDPFHEFFLTTTIHGCNQLGSSKHWFRKLFWLFVFVIGVFMAVYQSSTLISEYRRYVVIERSERKNDWDIPFPTVTVCVNHPIRWKRNFSEEFAENVISHIGDKTAHLPAFAETTMAEDFSDRERILLEELSILNASQRFMIGYDKSKFVIFCTFGSDNCVGDLYEFNDLYYGNCVSFNPGFPVSKTLNSTRSKSLNMLFRTNFNDGYPFLRRDEGLVMSVHSQGSAPRLNRKYLMQLYPGRWIKYGVSQIVTERLPLPYSSQCVENDDVNIQRKLLHHRQYKPYLYTIEACLDSCYQNLSIKFCNCFLPNVPFPTNKPKTLCPYEGCDLIQDLSQLSHCECNQACLETSYDSLVDTDDRWLQQNIWLEWVDRVLHDNEKNSVDKTKVCGFEIYMSSNQVLHITEEPKVLWADFLGSLGGNIGLWVGLSVLSILEIVELIFQLSRKILQMMFFNLEKP